MKCPTHISQELPNNIHIGHFVKPSTKYILKEKTIPQSNQSKIPYVSIWLSAHITRHTPRRVGVRRKGGTKEIFVRKKFYKNSRIKHSHSKISRYHMRILHLFLLSLSDLKQVAHVDECVYFFGKIFFLDS